MLPGYQRGGYVPAGFRGGSVTDGLVLLEVERQMWAPLGNARRSRQRILGAALILAVSLIPRALYKLWLPGRVSVQRKCSCNCLDSSRQGSVCGSSGLKSEGM